MEGGPGGPVSAAGVCTDSTVLSLALNDTDTGLFTSLQLTLLNTTLSEAAGLLKEL